MILTQYNIEKALKKLQKIVAGKKYLVYETISIGSEKFEDATVNPEYNLVKINGNYTEVFSGISVYTKEIIISQTFKDNEIKSPTAKNCKPFHISLSYGNKVTINPSKSEFTIEKTLQDEGDEPVTYHLLFVEYTKRIENQIKKKEEKLWQKQS